MTWISFAEPDPFSQLFYDWWKYHRLRSEVRTHHAKEIWEAAIIELGLGDAAIKWPPETDPVRAALFRIMNAVVEEVLQDKEQVKKFRTELELEGVNVEQFLARMGIEKTKAAQPVVKTVTEQTRMGIEPKPPKRRETVTEQTIRVEEQSMDEWKKEHQIEPPPDVEPFEEACEKAWSNFEPPHALSTKETFSAGFNAGWDAAIKHAKGEK